ncbi:hypothetical protein [Hydrogenophaga sp.]|uniref:hypothetical protein n=1 Tax=Hydrogenophaga sp. TaxID=1904254 RepID=UPI003F71DC0B
MKKKLTAKNPNPTWRKTRAVLATAAVIALSACGGSGGSGAADGTGGGSTVLTGRFLDAAVEGLSYDTPTQSGTTDADGQFKYLAGEIVNFKLYGQALSSSVGFSTLTPGDTGVEETDLDRIVNQLRFLQTVDADNNPSNGIRLPAYNGAFNIDFAQRIEEFESDLDVQAFLTAHAGGRPLVTVQDAIAHFSQSIGTVSADNVVSFAGRTATSAITNTACINNIQAQQRYAFGATSVTLSGSDGFINNGGNCTIRPDATEVLEYNSHFFPAGSFLSCLPNCDYKDVNFVGYGLDPDNRTVIELSWHTPGTQKVRYIKRVLIDPSAPGNALALTTYKGIITFD